MASMLFEKAPAGATLQDLESLRNQILIATEWLRIRRRWRGEESFVIVGELLKDTRTGGYLFVVQFPDKDTRAPKVVKKVLCRARREYRWACIQEQVRPDFGCFGLGYTIA